jgi:hypothetical protein
MRAVTSQAQVQSHPDHLDCHFNQLDARALAREHKENISQGRMAVFKARMEIPPETYLRLYIGTIFADTLLLSAREHVAFGRLLFDCWLDGSQRTVALRPISGWTHLEWQTSKTVLSALLRKVRLLILQKLKDLRAYRSLAS